MALGSVSSSSDVDGRAYIRRQRGRRRRHATQTAKLASSAYAGLTVAGSADRVYVNNNGLVVGGDLSWHDTKEQQCALRRQRRAVLGNSTGNGFNVTSYVAGTRSGGYANATTLTQGSGRRLTQRPATTCVRYWAVSSSLSREKHRQHGDHRQPVVPDDHLPRRRQRPGHRSVRFERRRHDAVGLSRQFVFDYGNARSSSSTSFRARRVDISAQFIGNNAAVIAEPTLSGISTRPVRLRSTRNLAEPYWRPWRT